LFLLLLSLTVNSRDLHLRMNLFNNAVYSDKLYMTTENGGLVSFDPEDSSWDWVNSFSGLPSNNAKDLFLRGDSIFVLSKGGLTILDKEFNSISFQNFNPFFFESDTSPCCIHLYNNRLILGGESGIQWFNLNDFGRLTRVVDNENYGFQVFEILPLDTCYLLGTSKGVYKVDSNFQDTTMIDNSGETYSLFVDGASIWAGGSWGCKEIAGDTAFFSEDTVWNIRKINEEIYIGSKIGLYRYEGDWHRIHGGDVRGFARISPGNSIISAVRNNGVRFMGSSGYIFSPGLISNLVTDLVQTPDGNIYVSYKHSRRISMFDGVEWKFFNRGNRWDLSGGYLFNMESDSEGRIYFGLWYWQPEPILFCWDTQNDTMPRAIELPVSSNTVTGLLVDENDDLWIGLLLGEGSCVLRMHRLNEGSFQWTTYSGQGISWKRVFAEGEEGIYCGNSPSIGGAGIHILKENKVVEKVVGNLGSSTTSMTADLQGNIWAGLETGLAYIVGNNVGEIYTSSNSDLISDKVDGLTVDFQGGIWCYNSQNGLSYLNPERNWESLPQELKQIQSFILADVISPLHFTVNKNLFVCTYNGLYEFDINFSHIDSGEVNVYPNPFNYERHARLNFSARELGGKNILIYNVIGDLEGEYVVPSEVEEFSLDFPEDIDLSSGLYMYFITENRSVIYKGKFVVVR